MAGSRVVYFSLFSLCILNLSPCASLRNSGGWCCLLPEKLRLLNSPPFFSFPNFIRIMPTKLPTLYFSTTNMSIKSLMLDWRNLSPPSTVSIILST